MTPLVSLKFLDDPAIACAWLQANGYDLQTISEYTAILRYGNPPAGGFPPPSTALGIPPNATGRRDIDEAAFGHFVTARCFILLHEMGHIVYRHHGGRTSAELVRNEEQADRFAVDAMKRTPLQPLGMLVFFMADAHWPEYPAKSSATNPATHPMSGERVRALAVGIDNPVLAAKLRAFGELLDDPEIRRGFAAGVAGDLAALAPRRPGALPHLAGRPRAGGAQAFDGTYRGKLVQFLDPRPMAAEFNLERRGDLVTGSFTVGLGFFRIRESKAVGNQLYFDWGFGPNYGRVVIEIASPGKFQGTWGYREARTGAGNTLRGRGTDGRPVTRFTARSICVSVSSL